MISILIVNHDGRDHLRHCLESLGPEPDGVHQVVVVDNASTDGSVEMVASDFPTVRLLESPENLGFGAANNRGAELVPNDDLLLLNSDAWLADGVVTALARTLAENPKVGAVAPDLRYPDGRRQFAWAPETGVVGEALQKLRNPREEKAWIHRLPPRWLRPILGPGWLSAACVLLRREAFDQVGGFDENLFLYFEDVDLSVRLRRSGWRLAISHEAVAFHVKGGSRPSQRGEIEYRRAQLYYYRKHRPRWEERYLRRRLRRKFERIEDDAFRHQLLELLADSPELSRLAGQ